MALLDDFMHRYALEEGSGTRVDSEGSDDLSPLGGDTVGTTPGRIGNCFDTISSARRLQNVTDIGLNGLPEFTFSVWVKPETNPGGPKRIMTFFNVNTDLASIYTSGSGAPRFDCRNSAGAQVFPPSFGPLTLQAWSHIVGTYSTSLNRIIIYVNGRLRAQSDVGGLPLATAATPSFILGGTPLGSAGWDGLIDEAWIWSRALSYGEATQLYKGSEALTYDEISRFDFLTDNLVSFTEVGHQFLEPMVAQSISFVPEVGTLAGDQIVLIDPVTGGTLWEALASSATEEEREAVTVGTKNTRIWPNGVRVSTLTGNRGTVLVRFA